MRNNTYMRFEALCKKYKGYVGTKELLEEGFSNRQIAVLRDEGYLEKISHGYYWMNGGYYKKPADYKCIEVCYSDPKAVICMGSALYYQGFIDEEGDYLSVATERNDRRLLKMQFPVKRYYFTGNKFDIGIQKRETEFGCYNIYDIERSVCDMVRLDAMISVEIINKIDSNKKQYERLMQYAELLNLKKLQVI